MQAYRSGANERDIEAAVRARIAAAGNALGGWIIGITVGLLFFAIGGAMSGMAFMTFSDDVNLAALIPGLALVLAGVATGPVIFLIVRAMNRGIAEQTRRAMTEGVRREGRIVQARRVSMSQARVIVQGDGFANFEEMITTGLTDAALFGRTVDVYVDPRAPGRPVLVVSGQ